MSAWQSIRGWLTEREGLTLRELARGRSVLELGAFCGRSTVAMAEVALEVVAVDSFVEDTAAEFVANIRGAGVSERVYLHAVPVDQFSLPGRTFDLVFVDTYHDAEAVERDTAIARQYVRPGGVIAWHDYGEPAWPDVAATLGRLGLVPDGVVDRLAWRVFA